MNRSGKHSRFPRMTSAMKTVVWPVVALALAAGILVGSAAAGSPSSSPTPVPSSTAVASPQASPDASAAPGWLSAIAADVASQNADTSAQNVDGATENTDGAGQSTAAAAPTSRVTSEWALCSVKAAAPLMGADVGEVPDDVVGQQCYVIVLKGYFVANNASVPQGRPAPEGNVIVCVIDPDTHKVMGFCLWPADLKVDTSSVSALAPLQLMAN
jgi:hypothetical protein